MFWVRRRRAERQALTLRSAFLSGVMALSLTAAQADDASTPKAEDSTACSFRPSADLVASGQPVVSVLLSPRMPYAIPEWKRMAADAEREGFRTAVYRDPRVPEQEWREAVVRADAQDLLEVPVMDEPTAASCGLLNHTPAALVSRCHQVHPWPILGVMPKEGWLAVLRSRLSFFQPGACE